MAIGDAEGVGMKNTGNVWIAQRDGQQFHKITRELGRIGPGGRRGGGRVLS